MKLTIPVDDAEPIEFECENTITSNWVSRDILTGATYPYLPFVEDVRVVFDVGANCGAATVHFSRHYPDAEIHSFEPGSTQRAFLERNTAARSNVTVHPFGLHEHDQVVPLYAGADDSGMSSVIRGPWNREESEPVELFAAGPWAADHDITRIDVLKLDVEGCEVDVLRSFTDLLSTVKVLYVEYDSRQARRTIDELVGGTHELYVGKMFLDQGEVVYLSKELASLEVASEHLRSVFVSDGD